MEDQGRKVGSDNGKFLAQKQSSLSPKHFTIMVIRSVGRIRSFKISKRLVFLLLIFILIYLVISLYVINDYMNLRYLYNLQSERLNILENDNAKSEKALLQTKQHIAILEDYVEDMQVQQGQKNISSKDAKTETAVVNRIAENLHDKNKIEEQQSKTMGVEDFIVREQNSEMSVDFKLVNTLPNESAMEGYIHIIASDNKGNLFPEWNYTENMLKDGLPVNFRRGQPFLIQRFKPYHRIYVYNSNSELPSTIRILIYDRSGKQILENEYKVNNVS